MCVQASLTSVWDAKKCNTDKLAPKQTMTCINRRVLNKTAVKCDIAASLITFWNTENNKLMEIFGDARHMGQHIRCLRSQFLVLSNKNPQELVSSSLIVVSYV